MIKDCQVEFSPLPCFLFLFCFLGVFTLSIQNAIINSHMRILRTLVVVPLEKILQKTTISCQGLNVFKLTNERSVFGHVTRSSVLLSVPAGKGSGASGLFCDFSRNLVSKSNFFYLENKFSILATRLGCERKPFPTRNNLFSGRNGQLGWRHFAFGLNQLFGEHFGRAPGLAPERFGTHL